MTPAAQIQAAIDVLAAMTDGLAAEQALTRWARGARYAGSKDRAAVRDHVFSVLRRKRSCAALGGGTDPRALMLGFCRAIGEGHTALFSGEGHAPAQLSDDERASGRTPTANEARDLPDWLWPQFEESLGPEVASRTAEALRHRAPICLRHNPRAGTVSHAVDTLLHDQVVARPIESIEGALTVEEGARRIAQSEAYKNGLIELQDASSQAAMLMLDVPDGARVLDYCAGGGGKTLALAARLEANWFAHDAAPQRMRDIPLRAARAGVSVTVLDTSDVPSHAPFDLVLCDVPCSGSGTWRRAPEAKWQLTPERLDELCTMQRDILAQAHGFVRPGGILAYVTCSVLKRENKAQIESYLSDQPAWHLEYERCWPVSDIGDGFYLAVMRQSI